MPENPYHDVEVRELFGGAILDEVDEAFVELFANVQDPNTDPKKKRRITVTIEVAPHESRESGVISYTVATKLPGKKPTTTPVFMGIRKGEPFGSVSNFKQADAFADSDGDYDSDAARDVRPIDSARKAT